MGEQEGETVLAWGQLVPVGRGWKWEKSMSEYSANTV
jgi:hypothetical protein